MFRDGRLQWQTGKWVVEASPRVHQGRHMMTLLLGTSLPPPAPLTCQHRSAASLKPASSFLAATSRLPNQDRSCGLNPADAARRDKYSPSANLQSEPMTLGSYNPARLTQDA